MVNILYYILYYSCTQNKRDIILIVVSPSEIVTTEPQSTIKRRNESVTLQCLTDAGPNNSYVWLYKASDVLCSTQCTDGVSASQLSASGIK